VSRRLLRVGSLALALGVTLLSWGCPLHFENEPRNNREPTTFFDFAPPDTTFRNEVQFRWIGTDLDSDVVAYQYQLVEIDSLYYFTQGREGAVVRSLVPRETPCRDQLNNPCLPPEDPGYEDERNFFVWTERQTENFEAFSELNDGWYEFRARAIDDKGVVDPSPARKRFYVFFDDVAPVPEIIQIPPHNCGRLNGATSHVFLITASDSSRHAATPRRRLQYQCRLRATSQTACSEHLGDPFASLTDRLDDAPEDGWGFFPSSGDSVRIGDAPPFLYVDLFSRGCTWEFILRVRDPAGIVATTTCQLVQPPN
jgi:hypothetical protein